MPSIKVLCGRAAVLALAAAPIFPVAARAQDQTGAANTVLSPLKDGQLQADAALQTRITHDAAAQPLNELLQELSKQSGVAIEAGDNAPAVKVTAHLEKMTLADVLDALSGLYGVQWAKSGDKTLRLLPANALDAQMRRIGDAQWFRFYNERLDLAPPHVKTALPVDWLSPVYDIADEKTLLMHVTQIPTEKKVTNPEGIVTTISRGSRRVVSGGLPFTEAPDDLQQQLRRFIEGKVGLQMAKAYQTRQRKTHLFEGAAVLHMAYPTQPGVVARDDKGHEFKEVRAPQIMLRTAAGETVSGLPFQPLQSSFALHGAVKEWQPPKPSPAADSAAATPKAVAP